MTPFGRNLRIIKVLIGFALLANLALWWGARDIYPRWGGVPPVPSHSGAIMMTLGDAEFSYRLGALSLQIIGDGGGQLTSLGDYNFDMLGKWFWLLDSLDPASNDVPMVAAYYYGGSGSKEDTKVVVDYLSAIGQNPVGNKWRWLVQAIYLARHKLDDLNLALDLSYKLSKMKPIGDTLPIWARQMPAFILRDNGSKKAAAEMVTNMLSSQQYFSPEDIKFMKRVLILQLGVPKDVVENIMAERKKSKVDQAQPKTPMPQMPVPMPE